MDALRGRPILVTFWASDCRSCLEEIPDLVALHQAYGNRGLQLIGVAMAYDPPSRVVALARDQALPYPIALDPLGRLSAAFGGVRAVPDSFLIGPDGRIEREILGRIPTDSLRQDIERLLPES